MTRYRLAGDQWLPVASLPCAPTRESSPSVVVKKCEHTAVSLPRVQGDTPAELEADRIRRGYPRFNKQRQPVFLTEREIDRAAAVSGRRYRFD
jgi:hypothetical protein